MNGGSSRKRMKMSHSTGNGASTSSGCLPTPSGSAATGSKAVASANHAGELACRHEQMLRKLNTDMDAVRQLVTCKICTRLLTEPYSLACGHTYCYICISGWFNQHRMTCPDCRTNITQQPAPSYLLKEMAHIFVSRAELLPEGETMEELHQQITEAAGVVAKDKEDTNPCNGGLFKGLFKSGGRGMPLLPIYDPGDGVDRCPHCNWEVEGGAFCNQCGLDLVGQDGDPAFGISDDDSLDESDDLDHDIDPADAEAMFGIDGHADYFEDYDDFMVDHFTHDDEAHANLGAQPLGQARGGAAPRFGRGGAVAHRPGQTRQSRPISLDSEDEEDSTSESEDDTEMEGFIDDDEHQREDSSSESEGSDNAEVQRPIPGRRNKRRAPLVISDDEESIHPQDSNAASGSEADSEDPVLAAGSQRSKRRVPPVVISDEEESSLDAESDDGQSEAANASFSPLQRDTSDDGHFETNDFPSYDGNDNNVGYISQNDDQSEAPSSAYATFDPEAFCDDDHSSSDDDGDANGTAGFANFYHQPIRRSLTRSADSRSETPLEAPTRVPARSASRSNNPGPRRNRHSNAAPRSNPPLAALRRYSERVSQHSEPAATTSNTPRRRPTVVHASQPRHAFQLSNTLANINNQERQIQEDHDNARSTSGASSQSSVGGVDVQGASRSSSGSSSTLGRSDRNPSQNQRPARQSMAEARRRKRAVSISSQSSEDTRVITPGRRARL